MEAAGRLEYYPRSATPKYRRGLFYGGSETVDGFAVPSEVIGELSAEDSRAIRGADATGVVAWRRGDPRRPIAWYSPKGVGVSRQRCWLGAFADQCSFS